MFVLPSTNQVQVRAGIRHNGPDVSLVCSNLLNTQLMDQPYTTFRPRTCGVTAMLHF